MHEYFLTHTQQAMQSSAVLPVKNTRQTIDSRDLFASRMCSMLGICNACWTHIHMYMIVYTYIE